MSDLYHRIEDSFIDELLGTVDEVIAMGDLSERERDLTILLRSALHELKGWRWLGGPTYASADLFGEPFRGDE